MPNSLDLTDGLDGVEIVQDVERTFGISIADHEAQATLNVGQLFELIEAKCGMSEKTRACLSQIAFYKLRRAFTSNGMGRIVPSTSVSILRRQHAKSLPQVWSELEQRSGLTLPPLETPLVFKWGNTKAARIFRLIGLACLLGTAFVSAKHFGLSLGWALLSSMASVVVGLFMLGYALFLSFRDIPRRIETMGDLAREAAGCTYAALRKPWRKESAADRWFALAAILRQQSGHKLAIDKNTTFYSR